MKLKAHNHPPPLINSLPKSILENNIAVKWFLDMNLHVHLVTSN